MNFKLFLENTENYSKDVKITLKRIPKKHYDLIKKYTIEFEPNNTLKGDSDHIGLIDEKNKKIKIAAPWNFSREFTILHEIAHAVYRELDKLKKKKWKDIVKKNTNKQIKENPQAKNSLKQNAEEIFCHCYANFYAKHKNSTYNNKQWMNFIKSI